MRITGGSAKGIPLKAPKGMRTRPTSDMVRKALFDTLGDIVVRRKVLDLFAGSGALGVEALSRGADYAVFVENNTSAARTIAGNLSNVGFSEKGEIIRGHYRSAVKKLVGRGQQFDLIFLDPPYEGDLLAAAAETLTAHRISSSQAVIVAEHFKKTVPPQTIADIPLASTRTYGQTSLSYYRLNRPIEPVTLQH